MVSIKHYQPTVWLPNQNYSLLNRHLKCFVNLSLLNKGKLLIIAQMTPPSPPQINYTKPNIFQFLVDFVYFRALLIGSIECIYIVLDLNYCSKIKKNLSSEYMWIRYIIRSVRKQFNTN